jgi:hypothetical protein
MLIRIFLRKVRCFNCSGEVGAEHVLLDCWETRKRRVKFLNGKWLNVNKEVA